MSQSCLSSDIEAHVEAWHTMGQPAGGNDIDTGLGDGGRGFKANDAAGFGYGRGVPA